MTMARGPITVANFFLNGPRRRCRRRLPRPRSKSIKPLPRSRRRNNDVYASVISPPEGPIPDVVDVQILFLLPERLATNKY